MQIPMSNWVNQKMCDLVAMSTHGHVFMADLVLGPVAIRVSAQRERVDAPAARQVSARGASSDPELQDNLK